jgi:hypothetical protein
MSASPDAAGRESEALDLPAPTAWPMVAAFGVTLGFAGLVTHPAVSIVGAVVSSVAAVGWWREALPVAQVERVPLRPPAERARPIVPSPAAVERLKVGEAGHRVRVPAEVQPYSAGIKGGLVGGVAMAVIALAYGLLVQGSLWYPINLISMAPLPSITQISLEELRAFNLTALLIGVILHGMNSVLVGLLYSVILPMLPRRPVLWGGIVAPLLISGGLWATLGVLNPPVIELIDWWWFVPSQIAFGLAAGFVIARAHPIATMQTWPLAARAGVQATGMRGDREGEP